jgi:tetratricopeptide (TPR) repeat protein
MGRGLFVLAGLSGLFAVLLGLSTNVASSLVSDEWAREHSTWVWVATGLLAVGSIVCAVLAVRRTGDAGGGAVDAGRDAQVIGSGARVERPTLVQGSSGPVVIAKEVRFTSVDAAPAPSARPGKRVVGELPGVPPAFVARDASARLDEVFEAGGKVATVCALGGGRGVGKTQIAADYARRAVESGVELVAWISGEDRDRLIAGLADVARELGVHDPEGDSERSAARLRDALAAREEPAVLVIDNANDPSLVRRYLPATGATRVVITSTDHAFASLGTEIDVGVFDREQSLAYVVERTKMPRDEALEQIAKELGDLPLALAQAAGVIALRRLSYREYLERLRALPLEAMLPAGRGDAYPHGAARAILLALDAAQEDGGADLTTSLLNTLALLAPEGVGRNLLHRLFADDVPELDHALARLVEQSLLVWAPDARAIVMHRLLARAIQDRLQVVGELPSAFAATADRLEPLLTPRDQAWKERADAADIVGHAVAVWDHAVRARDRDAIATSDVEALAPLAHWAVNHLREVSDLSRAIELGRLIVDACERVLGSNHPDTLTSRNNLAYAYESAGDLERATALYEQTLADSERILGPDHPLTETVRAALKSLNGHN